MFLKRLRMTQELNLVLINPFFCIRNAQFFGATRAEEKTRLGLYRATWENLLFQTNPIICPPFQQGRQTVYEEVECAQRKVSGTESVGLCVCWKEWRELWELQSDYLNMVFVLRHKKQRRWSFKKISPTVRSQQAKWLRSIVRVWVLTERVRVGRWQRQCFQLFIYTHLQISSERWGSGRLWNDLKFKFATMT